jgi:hypothetical protein
MDLGSLRFRYANIAGTRDMQNLTFMNRTRSSMSYLTGITKLFGKMSNVARRPLAGCPARLPAGGYANLQNGPRALCGSARGNAGPINGMWWVAQHAPRPWSHVNGSLA